MEELKKAFRPEFLNRIDETVVFHSLKQEEIHEIVKLYESICRETDGRTRG